MGLASRFLDCPTLYTPTSRKLVSALRSAIDLKSRSQSCFEKWNQRHQWTLSVFPCCAWACSHPFRRPEVRTHCMKPRPRSSRRLLTDPAGSLVRTIHTLEYISYIELMPREQELLLQQTHRYRVLETRHVQYPRTAGEQWFTCRYNVAKEREFWRGGNMLSMLANRAQMP